MTVDGMSREWIVLTKGSADANSFEISVVRADNQHGIKSYGWFGPDKILISASGAPCRDSVPPYVWDRLVRVAEEVAAELNAKEA